MNDAERRLPAWIWIGYVVLFILVVPWYFPSPGATRPHVWGFPLWGAVIVVWAVVIAVYTAFVYLKVWKDPDEEEPSQ